MKHYFPENFNSWDVRLLCDVPSRAIEEAVNLARLTGTPSILRAALYSCCQLNGHELLLGHSRADGVVETLSSEDLSRCINGKAKLCTRLTRHVCDVFDDALLSKRCKREKHQRQTVIFGLKVDLLEGGLQYGRADVLSSGIPYIIAHNKKGTISGSACSSCINTLSFKQEKGLCHSLWEELPELLELPVGDDAIDGAEAVG